MSDTFTAAFAAVQQRICEELAAAEGRDPHHLRQVLEECPDADIEDLCWTEQVALPTQGNDADPCQLFEPFDVLAALESRYLRGVVDRGALTDLANLALCLRLERLQLLDVVQFVLRSAGRVCDDDLATAVHCAAVDAHRTLAPWRDQAGRIVMLDQGFRRSLEHQLVRLTEVDPCDEADVRQAASTFLSFAARQQSASLHLAAVQFTAVYTNMLAVLDRPGLAETFELGCMTDGSRTVIEAYFDQQRVDLDVRALVAGAVALGRVVLLVPEVVRPCVPSSVRERFSHHVVTARQPVDGCATRQAGRRLKALEDPPRADGTLDRPGEVVPQRVAFKAS